MENDAKAQHHIVPLKVYLFVAGTLIVLTFVTIKISYIHLEGWNVVIALTIAAIKASLVVLFFMHLRYEWNINTIVFLIAIGFLAIFISITMFDMAERGSTHPEKRNPIHQRAIIYDQNGRPLRADSLGHGEHGEQSGEHKADSTARDKMNHEEQSDSAGTSRVIPDSKETIENGT